MRNYQVEFEKRVKFIKDVLLESKADGIVYGNSGGKDCTLVSILCKAATENVVGLIMPAGSTLNITTDKDDALLNAEKFNIKNEIIDLTSTKQSLIDSLGSVIELNHNALVNIAPRLRMTTLYAYGAANNYLIAGTGNKCELHVGYFTKWGDGANDFNPIADLTVSEIYEFLKFLKAPESIINKKPSAGLYEGQTDEAEMKVTYEEIEKHINNEPIREEAKIIIDRMHNVSKHKRRTFNLYQGD